MKKLTWEQALEIAKTDYNIGIINAIEKLEEFGFDTSFYYNMLKANEFDDGNNIKWRNLQYKMLGQYNKKILLKAYDEVWENGC